MEMTALKDRWRDAVDRPSFEQRSLTAELKKFRRRLSARGSEIETISVQLTEQKGLKGEAEQKVTDVQYKVDCAKVRIKQFEVRESVKDGVDRI